MKKNLNGVFFFSLLFLFIDQFIKIILDSKLVLNQSITLIKKIASLTLIHNTGAAFGIFDGSRYLLISIAIIVIVLMFIYLNTQEEINDVDVFTYSLLIGGILGNLLDRIIYGYVIDYLSINIGSYYFPVFNFADICIVLSIIIIFVRMIKEDLWN